MAQQTIVILSDDLTGDDIPDGEGGTYRFGLDGQLYEIDLNDRNAQSFLGAWEKYIAAGRKIKAAALNGHTKGRRGRTTTRRDTSLITREAARIREQMATRAPAPMPPPPEGALYSTSTPGAPVAAAADDLKPGSYDPKAVRAWASAKGIDVPARGRVPESVVALFREAGY